MFCEKLKKKRRTKYKVPSTKFTLLRTLLPALFAVALLVRVIGANFDEGHHYHPDERRIAEAVLQLSFSPLQLNPHFFAYGSFPFYVTGPALTWANHTLTGLTAADFGLVRVMSNGTLFDNTNHPNFSAGAPIVFGFFRANGTGVSGPGYTLSAGIDNWQVTIAAAGLPVAAAVPTLSGWALALLAFGIVLIGFAWTRRAR